MASTKRNNRTSKNNNPAGRNQYSGGVLDIAREKPIAAAAVAAGAAATGLFLWSKRAQITDQINNLTDQLGEWKQSMGSTEDDFGNESLIGSGSTGSSTNMGTKSRRSNRGKSQSDIAEEALTLKETGATL